MGLGGTEAPVATEAIFAKAANSQAVAIREKRRGSEVGGCIRKRRHYGGWNFDLWGFGGAEIPDAPEATGAISTKRPFYRPLSFANNGRKLAPLFPQVVCLWVRRQRHFGGGGLDMGDRGDRDSGFDGSDGVNFRENGHFERRWNSRATAGN